MTEIIFGILGSIFAFWFGRIIGQAMKCVELTKELGKYIELADVRRTIISKLEREAKESDAAIRDAAELIRHAMAFRPKPGTGAWSLDAADWLAAHGPDEQAQEDIK